MIRTLFSAVILCGTMIAIDCAAQAQQANVIKPLPLISMTAECSKCKSDKTRSVDVRYPKQYTPTNIEGAITSKTITRRNVDTKGKCSCGFSKATVRVMYGFEKPADQEESANEEEPNTQVQPNTPTPVQPNTPTPVQPNTRIQPKPQVQKSNVIRPLPFISLTAECAKCKTDKTRSVEVKYPKQYTPTNVEGAITSKTIVRRGVQLKSGKCSCGFGKATVRIMYGFEEEAD